jgi:hypothetical protein
MNTATARRITRDRSGGDCELRIDGVCLGRATNFQHRRNRSQQGPWAPSNGIDVCGSGTTGCHGYIHQNPKEADDNGWTVLSWEHWGSKPARFWHGLVLLSDDGSWTNLGDSKHTAGCAVWTSDTCDCQEAS